ncbi:MULTISPECIES: alpha/beta fold hydrolase [unclassified Nocardioides]|uniref:alpha/beta fold hydrolase n=1 Tax=unclassified Nocardioides TaxID=2615069 RepID=UPI0006F42747|nr:MULTISPECIES: alpha/beta hydrolase [unclassified Nocardioides]KRA32330.1 esterase [Nocardioides sp. Root614]KRA88982.1 esterase [Nocardioides sp. Root682]
MDIVLIAGMWLDGSAWDAVVPELEQLGHRPIALTLPGQGDGNTEATYDDQVAAVVAAVDAADGPALVVGHSAACSLAWAAADARPENVAHVALIGGMPNSDGDKYFGHFEPVDGVVPFPGWEPFAGPDSDDMSEELKATVAASAVAVPAAVTQGIVSLTDERRHDVPVTLVCPEFSPAEAKEWLDAGDIPELAKVSRLDYADIDSGHWPMFTRPTELARILADCTA